jgi:hypothetical protein
VDAAIERGSPAGCLSALLVAVVIGATLWFADFASERAEPAWEAMKHEAIGLMQQGVVSHVHSGKATADPVSHDSSGSRT